MLVAHQADALNTLTIRPASELPTATPQASLGAHCFPQLAHGLLTVFRVQKCMKWALFQMKNSNKIGGNSRKDRGQYSLLMMMLGVLFQGPVYISKYGK